MPTGFKDEVITQAILCRSALEDGGLRACVAAPPHDRLHADINGVDDYLGSLGGGSLGELRVIGLEAPAQALKEWERSYAQTKVNGRKINIRRVKRDVRTLKGLILLAGLHGQTNAGTLARTDEWDGRGLSFSRVSRFTGLSRDAVTEAIESLLAMEPPPITLNSGSLEVGPRVVGAKRVPDARVYDKRTGRTRQKVRLHWTEDEDWLDRPKLTIADPALVAIRRKPESLTEWLQCEGIVSFPHRERTQ